MKKMNKVIAVLSAAVMTASIGIFNVSAVETETNKKVAWSYKNSFGSINVVCYEDGSVDSYLLQWDEDVVFTFPEGVEPTLEYVNDERAVKIRKYNQGYYYFKHNGAYTFSTVEEGDNKYVLSLGNETNDNRPETIAIKTEIAKQLLADGKIVRADVTKSAVLKQPNYIRDITIELDDDTIELTEADFPGLDALYKVPYMIYRNDSLYYKDNSSKMYQLSAKMDLDDEIAELVGYDVYAGHLSDKDTLLNVPEICKLIKESNSHITKVYVETDYTWEDSKNDDDITLASPIYMQGDANRNNQIDIIDAVSIAKYLLHPDTMDEETIKLADINNDGTTDIVDAVAIAKKLLEKNKK